MFLKNEYVYEPKRRTHPRTFDNFEQVKSINQFWFTFICRIPGYCVSLLNKKIDGMAVPIIKDVAPGVPYHTHNAALQRAYWPKKF